MSLSKVFGNETLTIKRCENDSYSVCLSGKSLKDGMTIDQAVNFFQSVDDLITKHSNYGIRELRT